MYRLFFWLYFSLCFAWVLGGVLPSHAQTSTYTAETSNNTAACSAASSPSYCQGGFTPMTSTGSGTYNPAPGNVSPLNIHQLLYSGNTTKVFSYLEPWFCMNSGSTATGTGTLCNGHIQVGYNSSNSATVAGQAADMIRRGLDGVVVDWYGTRVNTPYNTATLALRDNLAARCTGPQSCPLLLALMEDQGAFTASCPTDAANSVDVTTRNNCIISALNADLDYMNANYFNSNAYLRISVPDQSVSATGRPTVLFFICEECFVNPAPDWTTIWNAVRAHTAAYSANTPAMFFIFRNANAFSHVQTNGGFAWVNWYGSNDPYGLVYLNDFYTVATSAVSSNPNLITIGGQWKGFDDTNAPWGSSHTPIDQQCGSTLAQTFQKAGSFYNSSSTSSQLPFASVVTWNDYEEGTEVETGIDNCLTLNASVFGSMLTWTPTFSRTSGSESTVDHYVLWDSTDGQNLTLLQTFPSGTHSVDLSTFTSLASGNHTLYVKAVGLPLIQNKMSNAVAYPAGGSGGTSGGIALVQQTTCTSTNTATAVCTLSAPPAAGDALFVFGSNNNVHVSSVSGGGVTWTLAATSGTHFVNDIFYGLNSSGSGASITVTWGGTTEAGAVTVVEFKGIVTTSALDKSAVTSGSSTTPATPAITTAAAPELVLATAAFGSPTPGAPSGGFTALGQAQNGTAARLASAYLIASATGTFNTSWTLSSSGGWDADIVSFKGTTGSGGATVPAAPSNLTATAASSSQINLAWTNNATNATGVLVERSPDNVTFTQIASLAATATSYQNTGLTAATTYYYRVRATNSAGNSAYSNVANATTQAASTVPAAPSNLTATAASSSQINLAWTNNATNATGVLVERSPDNVTFTQIASLAATATSYQDSGLTASTIYYYRVRATNTTGNSAYSNVASATTQAASTLPAAPSNLTATAASSSQINLAWTNNATNATAVLVERSPDNVTFTQIASLAATATTYQNTGLTASTTYYYRVRATNSSGNSGYSNVANATTQGTGGSSSIALVQQTTCVSTNTATAVCTLAVPPLVGDALVVLASNNNAHVASVTGGGVTWASAATSGARQVNDVYYGLNSSGTGTTVSITWTSSAEAGAVTVAEFSGVATAAALDQSAIANGKSATPATGSVTTTAASELVLASLAWHAPATVGPPANGFTALAEADNGNAAKIASAFLVTSSTGTFSTNWVFKNNVGWDADIITLKGK